MEIDAVRRALGDTAFGEVEWVAETASTNADLVQQARAGAPEGRVLVADYQSAGRGRLGRTWEAPAGASLLLSILTRPTSTVGLAADELHVVSTAVGIAAAEAARTLTGADIRLKWPNDLVIETGSGTRKLSGILAESIVEGDRVEALVVGIGINVNWPVELPSELADIAIALNHVAGREIDRGELLVALLRDLDAWYAAIGQPEGRTALLARYRELSATLGRRVRVELSGETIVGDAIDLTRDGHLLVVDDCPDRPREITAGDVIHLRPHGG
jgi:BirA family biotin operon repressor/biotin-[acetyl-CoA-carboxylase] ligase